MKKLFFKGCLFCLTLLISAVLSYAASDTVPKKINVQGKLTTDSGQPITGSGKTVSLYIFDSSGVEKAKITDTNVTLDSDGLYSVNFDISNKGLDFVNQYSFKVEANGVMSNPIQPFATSPYSFHSSTATYALVLSPSGEKLVNGNFDSAYQYKINVDTATYSVKTSSILVSGNSGQVWGMNGNSQGWMDPSSLSIATATLNTIGGIRLADNTGLSNNISDDGILRLRIPTASSLGGVKIGENINMNSDGTIFVSTGTNFTLGVVKVTNNNGLSINAGTISMALADSNNYGTVKLDDSVLNNGVNPVKGSGVYSLVQGTYTALSSAISGIKLKAGSNVSIDSSNRINVSTGTNSTLGVVKVPTANGLSVDGNGQVSIAKATSTGYGVVQIGDNIDFADGLISLKKGSSSDFGLVKTDGQTINASGGVISVNKDNITVSSAAYAQKDYAGHIIASYYQPIITGGASTITSDNLTASKALISNDNGKVAVSNVTSTELGYLSGVESPIQTQLNSKQATLGGQTTYSGQGSSTMVPQITTNNLGQVTKIKEVAIDFPTSVANATTASKLGDSESGFNSSNPKSVWVKGHNGQVINADLAEIYKSTEDLQPGDVVSIDTTKDNSIVKTRTADDTLVAGVISTEPGLLLNSAEKGYKLALVGKVPTKVCNEGGDIKRGDLLVSASIAGYAKKAGDNPKAGTVIGKALENFSSKRGTILVLVNLQ